MFATATLLLPLSKLGTSSLITAQLLPYVEMAVEILEAMDECVVARKSVEIIKHYLKRLRASDTGPEADINIENSSHNHREAISAEAGPQQPGVDFPVSYLTFSIHTCFLTFTFRNGHMALHFQIRLSMGLLSSLMTWEDFHYWEHNFRVYLLYSRNNGIIKYLYTLKFVIAISIKHHRWAFLHDAIKDPFSYSRENKN